MNKEKHIEEMADDVRRIRESYFGQADYLFAMKLYEDGYRKQNKIAKEIFEKIDEITLKYLDNKEYSTGDMVYDLDKLKEKYMEVM